MPGKRDSLRVWLEKNLNGNKIRGLEWTDQKKKIFRIRWKHASKHGWSSELDGCVFREWAIYSGKFKPGEKTKEEPKVWKANFRCALNALPDIVENVDERETRGNEAQKVFQMKPHISKHSKRNRGSSFRYRDTSLYEGCYQKQYKDSKIIPLNKNVAWSCASAFGGQWPEKSPPPLLELRRDREFYYKPERDLEAYTSYARSVNENEVVLPEHKIVELIDNWTHELDEKSDTRFTSSMQISNPSYLTNPVDACYQDSRYQVQSLRLQTPHHYYSAPIASNKPSQPTCFAGYPSHI